MPASSDPSSARKKLLSRIAAVQKLADAAKKAAKRDKSAFKAAKERFKESKRQAKQLKKDVKALKAELAALGSVKAARKAPAKTVAKRSKAPANLPVVETAEPVAPAPLSTDVPAPEGPAVAQ